MFTDESHVISCLVNMYNHKIFLKGNRSVLTKCSMKMKFTDLHVIFIFKGLNFFIHYHIT